MDNSTRSGKSNKDHATEFIHSLLHAASKYYDPVKAHEYYERTKELQGRRSGAGLNKKQKEAFAYSKSEIEKAQTTDTEAAQAERDAQMEAIQGIAEQYRAEISEKLASILERLGQEREVSAEQIAAEKKTKVDSINAQLKTDVQAISDGQSKDLDKVAAKKREALANLREKTQRELDAVPAVPKGISKEKAAQLAEERSSKLDKIRGDYSKQRQDTSDSFDDESDSIRQSAQNEKDQVRDKASDDKESVNTQASQKRTAVSKETANEKNLQRGASSSEREELTSQVNAAVDDARNQYETLKQGLKAKYDAETDSEYEAIKRTVR